MLTSMVNLDEFKDLYNFCKSVRQLYIYGSSHPQQMLAKALTLSGIKIYGFLDNYKGKKNNIKVLCFDEQNKSKIFPNFYKKGVLFIKDEKDIIKQLQNRGFRKSYILSEKLVDSIEKKVTPRKKFFNFEVNVADHCNMNCQCCDHYSPIAPKHFLNLESYQKDLHRMQELFGKDISKDNLHISLLGGEPLLHPNLDEVIKITRTTFPNAGISLVSNGILVIQQENHPKWNLFQLLKDNEVDLCVTTYPLKINYELIDKKAEEYGLKYFRYNDITNIVKPLEISDTDNDEIILYTNPEEALDPNIVKKSTVHILSNDVKNILPYEFLACYQFNECTVLRDGKIYQCPMLAYIDFFNNKFNQKLPVKKEDYIDIYKISDKNEIAEYISTKIPFCNYCNIKKRYQIDFALSKKEISEWSDIKIS